MRSKIFDFICKIYFIILIISMIGLFTRHLQIFLFDEELFDSIYLKVILLGLSFIIVIYKNKEITKSFRKAVRPLIYFLLFVLISFLILYLQGVDVIFLLQSYNYFYFYLLLLFPTLLIKDSISSRFLVNTLVVLGVITISIGLLQFILNDPLLDIVENNQVLVKSYYFLPLLRIRSFSLFQSALNYGLFLLFMLSVLVDRLFKKVSITKIFFLFILVIAISLTLTRNIYVGTVIILLTSLIVTKVNIRDYPTIYSLVVAIVMFLGVYGLSSVLSTTGLLDTTSLDIRINEWNSIIQEFSSQPLDRVLFGTGYYQSDIQLYDFDFAVDNIFIGVILNIGVLGFILWMIAVTQIIKYTVDKEKNQKASQTFLFLSMWIFFGMFNIIASTLFIVLNIGILVKNSNNEEKDEGLLYE